MIQLQIQGPRADIVIDNPARMNALSQAAWGELLGLIQQVRQRGDIGVLCLRGVGEAAFCAGGDITEYAALAEDAPRAAAYHELYRTVFATLRALPFGTVAAIPGYCLGAGLALAAACDFRVGTPKANFGITAVKRGLVYPVTEVAELLNLAGLPAVRAMILRGQRLDAATAHRLGLLDELVPARRLTATLDTLAERLAASAGPAYGKAKAMILAAQQLQPETTALRRLLLGAFGSDEFQHGTQAFFAAAPKQKTAKAKPRKES